MKSIWANRWESARRTACGLWGALQVRRADGLVLGFGGVLSPGRFVHGGAVKLLALRGGFACDEQCFSVLYLVSSARPEAAGMLVDRCRRRGIRFVWNQNGVGYPAWAGAAAERHNAPMRALRARAGHVVYQSEFCRRSAERFLGSCAAPHSVLLNPVDLSVFSPRETPLPRRPLRLLAMGTHNDALRVAGAVSALAELRRGGVEALLTVAGRLAWQGAQAEVAALVERLGLGGCVQFRPAFAHGEAAALCREHHMLMHLKYMDPCPTVVAEALACGLPVVGTSSGGLPEMVPAGGGRLLPVPEDWDHMHAPEGVAAAVAALDAAWAPASAAARRQAVERFDAVRWVAAHRALFATLF